MSSFTNDRQYLATPSGGKVIKCKKTECEINMLFKPGFIDLTRVTISDKVKIILNPNLLKKHKMVFLYIKTWLYAFQDNRLINLI